MSYTLFRGEIPDNMVVCHTCDNPLCVNPEHLWVGTAGDNIRDASGKGRLHRACGRANGSAVYTDDQIIAAREMYATGDHTIAHVAREFGMSYANMRCILRGQTWKHLLA